MREARCRICCGLLFQGISVDAEGHITLETEGPEIEWNSDGTKYYITCPYCTAKNIAVRIGDFGVPRDLEIIAAVMEDE